MPESRSESVKLAFKLEYDAMVTSSPGASSTVDPRMGKLMGQLAGTTAEVVPLTIKLPGRENARYKKNKKMRILREKHGE